VKRRLLIHRRWKSTSENTPSFQCDMCRKTYFWPVRLRNHFSNRHHLVPSECAF
jgi:hypothetical protein